MTPEQLKTVVASGLLSFPVTDFDSRDEFDPAAYASRIEWLGQYGARALFPAGGTGEFFSLSAKEYSAVVDTAVRACRSAAAVIATSGFGTRAAIDYAKEAERLGADGLLLFPPYLAECPQRGLREHIAAVCRATRLGVIVYSRSNMRLKAETLLQLAEDCPNLIGFKDGVGDLDELLQIRSLVGQRLVCINGMPTAEIFAEAFRGMGVLAYSSAIFNFVPKSAMSFYNALAAGDQAFVERFTRNFLAPYGKLRARQPGYAVSVVKAGVDLVGHGAGKVRPPLANLTEDERRELADLIARLGPQD